MLAMRSFTVDIRGPVHVADFGGSGPTMLLVHGLGGSHVNWLSVAPRLAEDHRVYAVDLPGFGFSPSAGRRSTVPANARLIASLIDRLASEPVILVGNSMGGLISLGVAVVHPDRLAALVLVDAALPRPSGQRLGVDPFVREFVLVYFPGLVAWRLRRVANTAGADAIVRRVLMDCTVDLNRLDPAVVEAHMTLERGRVQLPGWHEPLREATGSLMRTLGQRATVERWITRVTVPTLLMHGRRDRIVSVRSAAAAADLRPDWDFHVFEDVGHLPMLESPGEFIDALRQWLRRPSWYRAGLRTVPAALAG
jgi:pimeloyl-ACP methyl ester carboxylesterase